MAPNIAVVLVGWCIAQLFFNALLAAQVAVLPDQVPIDQRATVSGVLGVCLPIAAVSGTFLVQLFAGSLVAISLVPCAIGVFSSFCSPPPSRIAGWTRRTRPRWSLREFGQILLRQPAKEPGFRLGLR